MDAVVMNDVCKAYPGFLLDHVSLSLPEGAILGLVGENGAGKTTLIRLLLGMTRPDSGKTSVLGCEDLRKRPKIKEEVGAAMDEANLPPFMTAQEIGRMMGLIYRNWDGEAYQKLSMRLRLLGDRKFGDFSRGNKMKLAIACALSHNPRLLIFDEATSGLDPLARDELLDLLLDFTRDERHSILMSSHIVSDLEKACDYIAFLHEGRLLLFEEKDQISERYGKVSLCREDFARLNPSVVVGKRETPYGVECILKREALQNGGLPEGAKIGPVEIEELFVMMAKGGAG